jgi:Putative transposase
MRPCAVKHSTASGWNNCAATSTDRPCRRRGCSATLPGSVVLKLDNAWPDGTTHLVMSPLEFMRRLAALVPRPRLHLIQLHAVLASNAKLRALVVPQGPNVEEQAAEAAAADGSGRNGQSTLT